MGTQMTPLAYLRMKATASGVMLSAAIVRSPSFSRSSSSTTMIMRPFAISSTASSIVVNGGTGDTLRGCGVMRPRALPLAIATSLGASPVPDDALDVLREDVHFDVHRAAWPHRAERRALRRVRDDRDLEVRLGKL